MITDQEQLSASEYAARLVQFRRRYTKTCPACGREFEGLAIQRYDSAYCRVQDFRKKRAAKAAEDAAS